MCFGESSGSKLDVDEGPLAWHGWGIDYPLSSAVPHQILFKEALKLGTIEFYAL